MKYEFDLAEAVQSHIKAIGIGLYTGEKRTGAVWQLNSHDLRFPSREEMSALIADALELHFDQPDSVELNIRTRAEDLLEKKFCAPESVDELVSTAQKLWYSYYQFIVEQIEDSIQLMFSFTLVTADGQEATRTFRASDGIYVMPRLHDFTTQFQSAVSDLQGKHCSLRYSVDGPRNMHVSGSCETIGRCLEKQIFGGWFQYKSFWSYDLDSFFEGLEPNCLGSESEDLESRQSH
jgi:hypothetical protein